MPNRQRLLIGVLTTMVVLYLFDAVYRGWYEQPMANASQSIAKLEVDVHEGNLETRRQQNRLPQVDDLKHRCLPRDLEMAVTDYRSWLLEQLETSGLQSPSLDSSTPTRLRNIYDRLDFTVRSQGTLSQLTSFLHAFYAVDYLHKIRSMSLTPSTDGQLDISLTIEALSIPSVASETGMPQVAATTPDFPDLESFRAIAQRNVFRQGDPIASQIRLSAVTVDRQKQRQAWLQIQTTGTTRIVSSGDQFVVEGTQFIVESIADDQITILIDNVSRTVQMGDPLQPPDSSPRTR